MSKQQKGKQQATNSSADFARAFIDDVKAGRYAAYHASEGQRVRAALISLAKYRTRDVSADTGHALQVERARALLRQAADELNANDVVALSDVAVALIGCPFTPEALRPYWERNAALYALGDALRNPRAHAANASKKG